ncbi:hypothetical protein [Noviherbaspirillum aridicola]|uniref:Uncharacterized protein n=1 Tax=Noviherbaspirillum aridicola TaxID=2849687 RepID=A0ABQ4Q2T2_9BURK|nr:hypothetical protein [Noviherbaspirillum aridicola]GIZ51115.1 hypothetical protein NCCP691_11290 [Noviherbaspirillum aridicola]
MSDNNNEIILAQANTDAGFKLPGANTNERQAGSEQPTANTIEVNPGDLVGTSATSSREMLIGGGIFVVLLIAFFFARNAYANHLVAKRVSPTTAGSAGWLLFLGLSFLSAAIVLALVNAQRFLNVFTTAPLVAIGVAALVGMVVVGRR